MVRLKGSSFVLCIINSRHVGCLALSTGLRQLSLSDTAIPHEALASIFSSLSRRVTTLEVDCYRLLSEYVCVPDEYARSSIGLGAEPLGPRRQNGRGIDSRPQGKFGALSNRFGRQRLWVRNVDHPGVTIASFERKRGVCMCRTKAAIEILEATKDLTRIQALNLLPIAGLAVAVEMTTKRDRLFAWMSTINKVQVVED